MIPAAAGGRLPEAAVTQVAWRGVEPAGQPAWTGLLSVAVLIATMALFTVVAFELIQALPLVATGGEGH